VKHSPVGHFRWFICALLFFATTINYFDRQILSLLKPDYLDPLIGWNKEQFGWVNSAFQCAYAAGLFFFGWFVDKYGTKLGYAVSIAAWSLAAAGHALVSTFTGFLAARVFLGLGEGGNFPAAIKSTAQWFPKMERAFATSIFNSGANVGALLAPAIIPLLAIHFGWQSAFLAAGVAGFIWVIAWFLFYELPRRHSFASPAEVAYIESDRDPENSGTGKVPWLTLLRYRQTWSFITAKFLTDPVWWFFLIWLPDFFKETRHMDLNAMGTPLIVIYAIVTVLSIVGAYLVGWLIQRGWSVNRARKSGMFFFALCVFPIFLVTHVGLWGMVALIGLAGAAHQAWSANLFTTVSDMFPKRAVASVVGLGGVAGSAGGMMFPILSGKLLDHFAALGKITQGYAILFAICGFAYIVAFAINSLLAPKFDPIDFPDEAKS
jgi:ACS family hexuronate transporter-like MFS transporter